MEEYLFRDFIHPKQHYTAVAGNKMLQLQYSANMISAMNSSFFIHRFLNFHLYPDVIVRLVRGSLHSHPPPSTSSSMTTTISTTSTTSSSRRHSRKLNNDHEMVIDDNDQIVFFFNHHNRSLHVHAYKSFQEIMQLGPGDILNMTHIPFHSLPLGHPVPKCFHNKEVVSSNMVVDIDSTKNQS